MSNERELTIDELDAVSGGAACSPCSSWGDTGGPAGPPSAPANAATMALWNGLLRLYGY
jgi:hypothetical protein